jgi:hypothetical protein
MAAALQIGVHLVRSPEPRLHERVEIRAAAFALWSAPAMPAL